MPGMPGMATETSRQCARPLYVHQNATPNPTVSTMNRTAVTRSGPQWVGTITAPTSVPESTTLAANGSRSSRTCARSAQPTRRAARDCRPASARQSTGPINTGAMSPGRCSSGTESTPLEPLIPITMSRTLHLPVLSSQREEGM